MKTLAPGFLLAMPQLGDPNFHRSVVLMIEHGDGGAMGLVVNRRAPITLEDLGKAQSLKVARSRATDRAYIGGPVEPQRGFVLHDHPGTPEKLEVLPGLFLSVTVDALGPLLATEGPKIRLCLGFAGWGPKQLEQEIAQGSWLFADAGAPQVLEDDPTSLWDATLRGMGVDPATLMPGKGVN